MELKFKYWIEKNGEVILGDGKFQLLKAIEMYGSIQKAATQFRMSYRHAWGVIRKLERRAGIKIIETHVGGRDGGYTALTIEGKKLLRKYENFKNNIESIVYKRFMKYF